MVGILWKEGIGKNTGVRRCVEIIFENFERVSVPWGRYVRMPPGSTQPCYKGDFNPV